MTKKRLCIVGGGPSAIGLFWSLAQDRSTRDAWEVTIVHDQPNLGGHCLTVDVPWKGSSYPIDIGVQLTCDLLNPNVSAMLATGDFPARVPIRDAGTLKLGCGFPRDAQGNQQNWGNFPQYQQGSQFALWNKPGMAADCAELESFILVSPAVGYFEKTLGEYFNNPPHWMPAYQDLADFKYFFVDPYMSIINGYGSANLDQMMFAELFPLFGRFPFFEGPLASFSVPGNGWKRFVKGASSWVQAMYDLASAAMTTTLMTSTSVKAVYPDQSGQVFVDWGETPVQSFDKVVMTTDMYTNANLLNNPNNHYWSSVFAGPVTAFLPGLQAGTCYIHSQAENILSPDLMNQEEVMQFTSYWGNGLPDSYTTYIQKNIVGAGADGLYVTMYGPTPNAEHVPSPSNVIYEQEFMHGMWSPSYATPAKTGLHTTLPRVLARAARTCRSVAFRRWARRAASSSVSRKAASPDWRWPLPRPIRISQCSRSEPAGFKPGPSRFSSASRYHRTASSGARLASARSAAWRAY